MGAFFTCCSASSSSSDDTNSEVYVLRRCDNTLNLCALSCSDTNSPAHSMASATGSVAFVIGSSNDGTDEEELDSDEK